MEHGFCPGSTISEGVSLGNESPDHERWEGIGKPERKQTKTASTCCSLTSDSEEQHVLENTGSWTRASEAKRSARDTSTQPEKHQSNLPATSALIVCTCGMAAAMMKAKAQYTTTNPVEPALSESASPTPKAHRRFETHQTRQIYPLWT